ncbi:GIY-YIG nuclease family protein [Rhodococcus sp. T2V]|uniref:GIY-YIG nuclease family protein n=1 Tax=Rhodococcus sp. T2V TaxID=3034164 RepID=UPI0023E0FBD3|nr:GIY-YIG nuclease family protein [Rhodococcus sp. T2V]MDF3309781.1 GIY-YIG nuclease family protein [Rhodococcus sp. T2V]
MPKVPDERHRTGGEVRGSFHVSWLPDRETKAFFLGRDVMPILYRFRSASNELLYIGVTRTPLNRWHRHRYGTPWFNNVALIEFESISWDRTELEAAERRAIAAERPRYNRAHSQAGKET